MIVINISIERWMNFDLYILASAEYNYSGIELLISV